MEHLQLQSSHFFPAPFDRNCNRGIKASCELNTLNLEPCRIPQTGEWAELPAPEPLAGGCTRERDSLRLPLIRGSVAARGITKALAGGPAPCWVAPPHTSQETLAKCHAITARHCMLAAGPEWEEALAAAPKALDGWKEADGLIREAAVGDLKHSVGKYKLVG